jgi:ribA/ribD-fused uncharacterized protein
MPHRKQRAPGSKGTTSQYCREELIARHRRGELLDYYFFWGHSQRPDGRISKACFSQWYPAPFEFEGEIYPTAEHWMMAEKARLFGDHETCLRILDAPDPRVAKSLGRSVQPFDNDIWKRSAFDIVAAGNLHKFRQNTELRDFLLQTDGKILVEASPDDPIWGIGVTEDDPHARSPMTWRGENLLGFALMNVRDILTAEIHGAN